MLDQTSAVDLEEICAFVIGIAKEAGAMIRDAQPSLNAFASKKNTADIVTETDRTVENHLRQRLEQRYSPVLFVGEESYQAGSGITDSPTFVVDPIDGTSNFVHGFPAVCTSIGLVIKKEPTVGVVYNPYREELWYAIKGHGAFYQGYNREKQKLPLVQAPLRGLESACIGIEWGSDREGPNFDLNLKVFTTLARTVASGGRFVNSLRCTGSAAITICRVAAAQQEAFWECGSHAWDVAAAWCILVEAGGIMVDGHPGVWNPPVDNRRYLAVRPAMDYQEQRNFVKDFWSIIGDDRTTYGPSGHS